MAELTLSTLSMAYRIWYRTQRQGVAVADRAVELGYLRPRAAFHFVRLNALVALLTLYPTLPSAFSMPLDRQVPEKPHRFR
jgi:hypothetical protein